MQPFKSTNKNGYAKSLISVFVMTCNKPLVSGYDVACYPNEELLIEAICIEIVAVHNSSFYSNFTTSLIDVRNA